MTTRPKVEVRQTASYGGVTGKAVAWCHEPDCKWVYVNGVKTDVQDQAKYHREHHRREAAGGAG